MRRTLLIALTSIALLGAAGYSGGYYLVTDEWPWQAGHTDNAAILREAAAPQPAAPTPPHHTAGSAPTAPPTATLADAHGTLHEEVMESTVFSTTVPFLIYLPPGYDTPAASSQRYPVVYLLHGAPGNYHDWVEHGFADRTADLLTSSGQLPPVIMVMPDGQLNLTVDSEWADGAGGAPQAESMLTKELVPFIDAHYRTIADADHRAIGGLSSGGYGAVNITLHHPDLFHTAIGISGVYSAPRSFLGKKLFLTSAAIRDNSPAQFVRTSPAARATHIFLAVGTSDLLDSTQAETKKMEQALIAAQVPHMVQYAQGGHSWDFWGLHLVDGLRFFGSVMASALTETTATPSAPAAPATTSTPTSTHGTLRTGSISSTHLRGDQPYQIYLPPGYDDPTASQRYPVAYLLHGAPGTYTDWAGPGKAAQTMDALIATGAAPPMILVMPEGVCNLTHDSEWVDGSDPDLQAESYLTQDVIPTIDQRYRTIADAAHRMVGGLSTGAYGGLTIALHHPDLFGTAFGISGNYLPTRTVGGQPLFASVAAARANTPLLLAAQLPPTTALRVYLAVGQQDTADHTREQTRQLARVLTGAHIAHHVDDDAGGHTWSFWAEHLGSALRYFAASLSTPGSASGQGQRGEDARQ